MTQESDAGRDFGSLLTHFRVGAGLTQEELAQAAELSSRAVSDLERGVRSRPRAFTVRALADALQLTDQDRDVLAEAAVRRPRRPRTKRSTGAVTSPGQVLEPHAPPQISARSLPVGGFLGSVPDNEMIGRSDEVALLVQTIDGASSGTGAVITVSGEPGIGKTRLGQELTLLAHNRGFLVAAGSCSEADSEIPYFPFFEMLEGLCRAAPDSLRTRLTRDWPYLMRLLPGIDAGNPVSSGLRIEAQEERQRLLWTVTDFIREVSKVVPVALLLDDVHWADRSTIELMQHMSHHTRSSRVLALMAYRDSDIGRDHPFRAAILTLSRQELLVPIHLRALDTTLTGRLVAMRSGWRDPPVGLVRRIFERTEGNPFFVQEMVRSLLELTRRDDIPPEPLVDSIRIPPNIRTLIHQRLRQLSDQCRDVLERASFLGMRFGFDELLDMVDLSEEVVDESLESALATGMVRELDDEAQGDVYGFNHPLTRQVIYEDISPGRRRRMHLAAGMALEKLRPSLRDQRLAELATHFRAGNDRPRALLYSLRAADQATNVFAFTPALAQYRTALEMARAEGDEEREREALEGIGSALVALGIDDEALMSLEEAAHRYRAAGDHEGEWRTAARIGEVFYRQGAGLAWVNRLEPLAEEIGDQVSVAAVLLLVSLAAAIDQAGLLAGQLDTAVRSVAMATRLGDSRLLARALGVQGRALTRAGRMNEALECFRQAVALAEQADDPGCLQRNLEYMRGAHYFMGEPALGRECNRRAWEVAVRVGGPAAGSMYLLYEAQEAYDLGEWDRAAELCRSVEEETAPDSRAHSYARLQLAWLDMRRGTGHPRKTVESILRAARQSGDSALKKPALLCLSHIDLLDARPAEVIEYLSREVEAPYAGWRVSFGAQVARALMQEGRLEEALTMVTAMAEWEAHGSSPCQLQNVEGAALARIGKPLQAREILSGAVECWRLRSVPFGEAQALEELALAEAMLGDRESAKNALDRAYAIYRGLGATPSLQRAEQCRDGLAAGTWPLPITWDGGLGERQSGVVPSPPTM